MNGSLRYAWQYFAADIWNPLAAYSAPGAVAPPSLFGDLFVAVDEFLSPRSTDKELELIRNDPRKAEESFLALAGTDFTSESAIVFFLEDIYDVIVDYEIQGFEGFYCRLLRNVISKFNLRYRLDEPFALRFLLPGSFSNLYFELHRMNASSLHLSGLWLDFETGFDRYARTQSDADLRTSVARASNYLEGLASATNGRPGTLGKLCDSLTEWPHNKVKDAVKNLYGFCCDYPGIRHGGTPANSRRRLDMRDSVAINVSLMALAAYLGRDLDQGAVLGVGSSISTRSRFVTQEGQPVPLRRNWIKKLFEGFLQQ